MTATCAEYDDQLIQAWLDGQWQAAATCPYDLQIGTLAFGFMIYGAVMTGLYVRTQSLVLPMVVTVMGGTIAISRLPSMAHQLVGMTIMIGLAIGAYMIYVKVQNIT